LHELGGVVGGFLSGTVESNEGATFVEVKFGGVDVKTVGVVNGGVVFNNTDNVSSVLG
jgi:glutamine amidotransferase-like uncharacterized protein